jgi:hypothetical protein
MKYTYTDITTIESNIALSLSDIEMLIEYFRELEGTNKGWTVTKFEKLLIQAREDTYTLMRVHADSYQGDENA